MVEVDLTTVILPILIPVGIGLFFGFVKKVGKSSEGTLSGTIKLEHVQGDLSGLNQRLDKSFDKLEQQISTRSKDLENMIYSTNRETEASISKMWDLYNGLKSLVELHGYRLTQIESKINRGAV